VFSLYGLVSDTKLQESLIDYMEIFDTTVSLKEAKKGSSSFRKRSQLSANHTITAFRL